MKKLPVMKDSATAKTAWKVLRTAKPDMKVVSGMEI
jgi:hypothetical protein